MTPVRLRALLTSWPDPRDAVAAIRTERAVDALDHHDGSAAGARRPGRARTGLERASRPRPHRARPAGPAGRASWWRARPDTRSTPASRITRRSCSRRATGRTRSTGRASASSAPAPPRRTASPTLGSWVPCSARAGVTVVSGLAIGIDGAAHEGALDAGGTVVGVVATGLDVEYPIRHGRLHRRVREQGLLVSEYRVRHRPAPVALPGAQPDHRRALRRARRGGGHDRRWRQDHRRPGTRLRTRAAPRTRRRDGTRRRAARTR